MAKTTSILSWYVWVYLPALLLGLCLRLTSRYSALQLAGPQIAECLFCVWFSFCSCQNRSRTFAVNSFKRQLLRSSLSKGGRAGPTRSGSSPEHLGSEVSWHGETTPSPVLVDRFFFTLCSLALAQRRWLLEAKPATWKDSDDDDDDSREPPRGWDGVGMKTAGGSGWLVIAVSSLAALTLMAVIQSAG